MLTAASVASRAASLAWPYRFCTVPAASRARPDACVFASPAISPAALSTLPAKSFAEPAIRSVSMTCPLSEHSLRAKPAKSVAVPDRAVRHCYEPRLHARPEHRAIRCRWLLVIAGLADFERVRWAQS